MEAVFFALGWKKFWMDIWYNASFGDDHVVEQFAQLFVITNGQLEMSWVNATLLVVACSIAGEFEDFGSQVLEHCREIHWCARSDTAALG